MKRLFAALLSLLLLAAPPAVKADGEYDPIGQQFTGVHAPYVTEEGTPSDTEFFTDADFALNRITVVNFWDTGCMNCRIEMPDFERAYIEYRDHGVGFLGVATRWIGGSYDMCRPLLDELGITYPNVFIDDGFNALTAEVHHCPQTMIVDSEGYVVDYVSGRIDHDQLEEIIIRHIAITGDADCDGTVSFSDVTRLFSFLMNAGQLTALGLASSDINGDGVLTMDDVSALACKLLND